MSNQTSAGQPQRSELDDYAGDIELLAYERYASRQWNFKYRVFGYKLLDLNPVASIASIMLIAFFVFWCIFHDNAKTDLEDAKKWIKDYFTWLYILSQNIWFIFLIVLLFTPYANIKLGRPNDKPDFSLGSWFMMLFAAGLGIGLFFYGVAEPVWHYEPCYGDPKAGPGEECKDSRYSMLPDNERAQWSINLALYHWGLYGWVVYIVVAVLLGYMTYKEGLPLTMKSTFYPLIGDKIFGWIGDVIDVISVATTLFGVCTSLGLGVKQINAGIVRLNGDIPNNEDSQVVIIWVITCIATISVVSGVKVGIRRLSEITFCLGTFLLLAMFFMEDTFYLLNLTTQSIGFYIQYFPQLSFHSDAFEQVFPKSDAEKNWMDGWTIFYWGWWVAWAPFVGMFIAKISKGRTIREIIIGGLIGPTVYSIIWFCTFGGAGLKMEREAWEVYNITSSESPKVDLDDGHTITRLAFSGTADMWFDLFEGFPLSTFYSVISLMAIILYFVTSSDSGSLVIDILTSNGNPEPPTLQRIFWALMEGSCATALVVAGGDEDEGLTALQTVSVVAGLPYTIVLCLMCQALWISMRKDMGHISPDLKDFDLGLFDPITEKTCTLDLIRRVVVNSVFMPALEIHKIATALYGSSGVYYTVVAAVTFYAWPLLLLVNIEKEGLWVLAWISYVAHAVLVTFLRLVVRSEHKILGDVISDFLVSIVCYPLAVVQMAEEVSVKGIAVYSVQTQVPTSQVEFSKIEKNVD